MKVRLNLSLNENVVKSAKEFACSNQTSLSKIIENYLDKLTAEDHDASKKISPLVQSLLGVLDLPADFDHKVARAEYLRGKYL